MFMGAFEGVPPKPHFHFQNGPSPQFKAARTRKAPGGGWGQDVSRHVHQD